ASFRLFGNNHCSYGCFRGNCIINISFAVKLINIAAALHHFALNLEYIAWANRFTELRIINSHEINEFALKLLAERVDNENAGSLRHSFNNKHTRHYRALWKMPLEEIFINRNILDTGAGFALNHINYFVQQEEWIPVRDHLHNSVNI